MTAGLFCAIVAITNAMGAVAVDTHGARVVSYVPVGGEEVFFVSKTGIGGMPVCWPWFGDLGPKEGTRRHGVGGRFDYLLLRSAAVCAIMLVLRFS